MRLLVTRPLTALLGALVGCGGGGQGSASATATSVTTATTPGSTGATSEGTGGPLTSTSAGSGQGDTFLFDVGTAKDFDPTGGAPPSCEVVDDMNGVGECGAEAPPDSFEPAVQWTWTAPDEPFSIVTPLVANFTDDNGDGAVDLCDVPDIVIVAVPELANPQPPGHIYLLDGATGSLHFKIADPVADGVTPAIGDIDGDGLVEIVTLSPEGNLVAFEHDGAPKWAGAKIPGYNGIGGAVALGDVDNDGDVEIVYDDVLADHNGLPVFEAKQVSVICPATALADLDGDGDLELVFGHAAYHHTGAPLYTAAGIEPGFPQVANLDDDPQPEVLVANTNGITLLEHDGAVKYKDLRPTGDPADGLNWSRPATVHDFDGDGAADFALSSSAHYSVFERDGKVRWTVDISDPTGIAAGTVFDFLGDGGAEAMYADEQNLYIYDDLGGVELMAPRTSRTLIEYPIVVDVDNDGSAEIVVVSNETTDNVADGLTVQVIRDADDRWIQARRIWNQHTYHVTNVREDGTIPQHEPPSWQDLNTYRTNAQIEGGKLCLPPPPK